MKSRLRTSQRSYQLGTLLVLCFLVGCVSAGEFEFLGGDKCVPLKVLGEENVETKVGEVCVEFKDDTQEKLLVTYNTSSTDYVITKTSLFYSHDIELYPRLPGSADNEEPDPDQFPIQNTVADQQTVTEEIDFNPRDYMECPASDVWKKYFVAYAKVKVFNQADDTAVEVYGHEDILYSDNNIEFFSCFHMKVQCTPTQAPTPTPTDPPTKEPETNRIDNNPEFVATPEPTAKGTEAPSHSPSFSPSFAPSLAPSASPSAETTSNSTDLPSAAPSLAPSAAPSSTGSAAPSMSPSGTPAPSLLRAERLVVGMSFIVITETSQAVKDLPHETIQTSFEGFAHNVMADMHVPSWTGGAASQDKGRRNLWVKYDESTFTVYDFLVNTDCIPNNEQAQAVSKTSSLRPPPTQSQCHRAYARFGVLIADEDPVQVCDTLRNGTLAGYAQGRLQDAHEREHPDSPIQLKPGDFEYCVPIEEFEVPDHGEDHWMDSDPLANLTLTREVQEKDDKPWLIPLIIALCLLLLALILAALVARRRGNKKHKDKEGKLATEEKALMDE